MLITRVCYKCGRTFTIARHIPRAACQECLAMVELRHGTEGRTVFGVQDIEDLPGVIRRLEDLHVKYEAIKRERAEDFPSLMKYVHIALGKGSS